MKPHEIVSPMGVLKIFKSPKAFLANLIKRPVVWWLEICKGGAMINLAPLRVNLILAPPSPLPSLPQKNGESVLIECRRYKLPRDCGHALPGNSVNT